MKKVFISAMTLCIGLVLSGCGTKTLILSCTGEKEEAGFNDESEINMTYIGEELIGLDMSTRLGFINGTTEEELSETKELFDFYYAEISENDGINIAAELDGEKIIINVDVEYETLSDEGENRVSGTIVPSEAFKEEVSIEKTKEALETIGYTCTIKEN